MQNKLLVYLREAVYSYRLCVQSDQMSIGPVVSRVQWSPGSSDWMQLANGSIPRCSVAVAFFPPAEVNRKPPRRCFLGSFFCFVRPLLSLLLLQFVRMVAYFRYRSPECSPAMGMGRDGGSERNVRF